MDTMRATILLPIILYLCGCTASQAEWEQQAYWRSKADHALVAGTSKSQVLEWARTNALATATANGLALMATPVDTRWPHIPCSKTFTVISLDFDQHDKLTSFRSGRAGVCF